MTRRPLFALVLCLALVLNLVFVATASAETPSGTVVASGLGNPRGITVASDGTIYVAESGTGGADKITLPPPFMSGSLGMTAQITRVAPDGTKSVVVAGLPSIAMGPVDVIGVKGIVQSGNDLIFTVGYTLPDSPAAYSASLMRVPKAGGQATRIADIGANEKANNPDGLGIESDAYGLDVTGDGSAYVADAGGNAILKVDKDGKISVVAVLGGLPSPIPSPARGGKMERDPVPTSVVIAPDGTAYVSLLGGFPFTPVKVVKWANGQGSDLATGLNPMVDITMGPDGKLYATEFGSFNLGSQPPDWVANSGRVVRIGTDGSKQVVVSGLNRPNGITFDSQGRLYVVDNSNTPPAAGGQGRILRFDAAALTGSPYPAPAAAPAAAPTAAPAQVPTQLPRTGDVGAVLPALTGLTFLAVGWRLRRR